MPTALVTGASSGLGLELATLLARDRHDLVLVARRRDRIEAVARGLSEEFGVRATALPADLARPEAPGEIVRELEARGLSIDVLVNDAGFGAHGLFADVPVETDLEMIRVNVSALVELTRRLLPGMLERRRGRILNLASTAAFQPGPLMAVYYATKAFVLSFSEALASETAGTGVTVTTLCPGPIPTEFQKRAGVEKTALFTGPLVLDAPAAALAGYRGMKRGQRLVIPGVANRVLVQALRVTPRRLATAIARRIQEKRR
ncbi:MAG TPA: SDR family oxidoreductase [Thermoanaerobaculia bacterium]|nr:SDR family oxidoreductase [Thermoanaerobaculia bacterium]